MERRPGALTLGEADGLRGVRRCAARMGRHVGRARRLTCGSSRRCCGRIADIPGRRVRTGREGANRPDPHLAAGEGPEPDDGIPRACVARSLRLEERQCPLGTVGGPHGQHSPVVLAQGCQGTRPAPCVSYAFGPHARPAHGDPTSMTHRRLAFHTQGFSHRLTRLPCHLTDRRARYGSAAGPRLVDASGPRLPYRRWLSRGTGEP